MPDGDHSGEAARLGQAVRRLEDRRLLTGRGRFADDLALPDALHAWIVRSPVAHARIAGLRTAAALAAPGVQAVLTGADFAAEGWGDIPCESMPPALTQGRWHRTPFPALLAERVMAVGDPVALVVATSRDAARDAAERVEVDYHDLPAVVGIEAALRPGAPQLYPDAPGNLCFDVSLGDAAAARAAFAGAHAIVESSSRSQRVIGAALEMRGAIGRYDPSDGRFTLVTSTQNPHSVRALLAQSVLRVPAHRIRVVARDVGGSFGTKGRLYPEDVLVLWAARRLGRPVKWIPDRSDAFLADFHGRDQQATGRAAFDADGRLLALEADSLHDLGCRLGPATGVSPFLTARLLVGPYLIPAAAVRVRGLFTNTRTTTSYRGAGRPEATLFIERLLDRAAARLGLDAVEIRRRNLVPADRMPYRTALLDTFDCGELHAVLDRAVALADWTGFPARRRETEARGRLRGRGISSFIEVAAIANERMEIRFDATGQATVVAGTFSHGQGHETVYAQMLAGWLGLPIADVRVLQGDTDAVSHGGGTYASRSVTVGGSALRRAADAIIAQGCRIAAWMLAVPAETVRFADGVFSAEGSNRTLRLAEVAQAAYRPIGFPAELGVGLEAVGTYTASAQNYPNGCHAAEVEVDPETGAVTVERYVAVDDVGTVVNPLLLEGQIAGSIAQGLGQALLEGMVYDANGQLLSGSFLDYAMPRAHDMPALATASHPVPTATNPLGVKGGAEMGTIAAPPLLLQAILDALRPYGIDDLEMPVTPARVWEAINRSSAPGGKP